MTGACNRMWWNHEQTFQCEVTLLHGGSERFRLRSSDHACLLSSGATRFFFGFAAFALGARPLIYASLYSLSIYRVSHPHANTNAAAAEPHCPQSIFTTATLPPVNSTAATLNSMAAPLSHSTLRQQPLAKEATSTTHYVILPCATPLYSL